MLFIPGLRSVFYTFSLTLGFVFFAVTPVGALPNDAELRTWIDGFKVAPRGPFERIRWFCKDGSVMPPKAYACKNHGGGIQHGEWNQRAKSLRAGGFSVANVLASVDPNQFVGGNADRFTLQQILIERSLIAYDDGWIFRGARSYRGAFQIEDEEAGSLALVHAMLRDSAWLKPTRFLLLRETVRALPLLADERLAADVRQRALEIAGKDKAFTPLRAKIHNLPDAGDAAKVRAYAKSKGQAGLRGDYERLAKDIDALFSGSGNAALTLALAPRVASVTGLSNSLRELGRKLQEESDPATRLAIAGRLMGLLRKYLPEIRDPDVASEALQLSVALERDGNRAGAAVRSGVSSVSRSRRLELLDQTAEALYGAGLLTLDQLSDVKQARKSEDLGVLAKPPAWAEQALDAAFTKAVAHLARIEPKAHDFTAERLNGSLVPFYRSVVDSLR
jgi:hypothetical protein